MTALEWKEKNCIHLSAALTPEEDVDVELDLVADLGAVVGEAADDAGGGGGRREGGNKHPTCGSNAS